MFPPCSCEVQCFSGTSPHGSIIVGWTYGPMYYLHKISTLIKNTPNRLIDVAASGHVYLCYCSVAGNYEVCIEAYTLIPARISQYLLSSLLLRKCCPPYHSWQGTLCRLLTHSKSEYTSTLHYNSLHCPLSYLGQSNAYRISSYEELPL